MAGSYAVSENELEMGGTDMGEWNNRKWCKVSEKEKERKTPRNKSSNSDVERVSHACRSKKRTI